MNVVDEKEEKLNYTIHKYSSYSGIYTAEKILANDPTDQTSRWSSESNNPPQFLVLKLEKPAIVKKIVFGKFERSHVCNLKRFVIYGSLSEKGYVELFSGGLKNDCYAETFNLRHSINGNRFPCLFIKIVPVQSWAVSYNFSIWYVELLGDDSNPNVSNAVQWLKTYKEREALRLCLKHLRRSNFADVFELLQNRSNVFLEDEIVTKLHQALVVDGNFDKCEEIVAEAAETGAFDEHINRQIYVAEWLPIETNVAVMTEFDVEHSPGVRGGHQMIIDVATETIFLFGGWDGYKDLADFWAFNMSTRCWTCISRNTELDGGPSPRSCHKMAFDSLQRRIFCLGRYIEASSRLESNLKNDFFVYEISTNHWQLICDDTSAVGGPKLIFDHQMVVDQDREIIYCFGGRILAYIPPSTEDRKLLEQTFSGLFAYHIPTDSWVLIREDCNDVIPAPGYIRSRIGHSMLFHQPSRSLYIFAGQRVKDFLTDMFIYHIDRDEIEIIGDAMKPSQVPVAGFTQRATIDTDLNEIYVFSGLSKDREKKDDCVQNSFWVYSINFNTWTCIYQNDSDNERNDVPSKLPSKLLFAIGMRHRQVQEPCPRYAHQLVYDNIRKLHYLFGGNPGRNNSSLKIRLDDFWQLKLNRTKKEDLVHKCIFMLRKCKFHELLDENSVAALEYLQKRIGEIVHHDDREETDEFHHLAGCVFTDLNVRTNNSVDDRIEKRQQLFATLNGFFPDEMTPPKDNLVDLIPIS